NRRCRRPALRRHPCRPPGGPRHHPGTADKPLRAVVHPAQAPPGAPLASTDDSNASCRRQEAVMTQIYPVREPLAHPPDEHQSAPTAVVELHPIASPAAVSRSPLQRVLPYLAIARPDHWFKNVFMLLGVLLVCFYHPELLHANIFIHLIWAVIATCLVASSN